MTCLIVVSIGSVIAGLLAANLWRLDFCQDKMTLGDLAMFLLLIAMGYIGLTVAIVCTGQDLVIWRRK